MVCWKFLVTLLVLFLQSFLLPIPIEAVKTTSFPLKNTTEVKVRCIDTERKALLRIKQSLIDPSGRLSSWGGKECCTWSGVLCDNRTGNIISLDLKDKSGSCYMKRMGSLVAENSSSCLGGNISPALLHLQHLQYLDLAGNDFQGLSTPSFLGSLTKLRHLNLSFSSLVGIPPSLGNLSNLHRLDLHADSYPQYTVKSSRVKDLNWVSGMSSLEYLDLSYVDLSLATNWLEPLNKLPSLVTLRLQFTNLHYLPDSLKSWNMTSLSHLYLTGNTFVNSVLPKWLSNATTIESFDIENSNIEGPISNVEWGKLCKMRELNLKSNKISGDISVLVEGLSSCSNTTIEALTAEVNKLTGQFPNSLGLLKNLRSLHVCANQISGTIPASFSELSRLETLDLGSNQLTGAVRSVLNLSELTELRLATNAWEDNLSENHFARLHQLKTLSLSCGKSFAVSLSDEWVPPFSLEYVELRSCNLGPTFPTWVKTQKQLHQVILTNDSISDPIPPWLWTLCSQLQALDLSHNQIGGNLPRSVNFPSSTISWTRDFYYSFIGGVVVDLSSNRFHGLLPLWPNVTHLNLADNLFSGSIPLNIGHVMTKLQVLDLSGNDFTGPIPYSFTRVTRLLRMDLSANHLSGKIPDWWHDLQQLRVIDLSGNNLSGSIPPSVCSPPSLFWLRLSGNNLSGELPKSLSNCKSLLTLDIGENKIHGTIPEWFGESLLSLQKLRMTGNMIAGSIPPQLCNLSSLQILDLSNNNLTGVIPSCLGNLKGLKSVEFYQWQPNYYYFSYVFTPKMELVEKGTRKSYTYTLDQVNLIDISCNKLHGEIPSEITGLSALGTLNLSRNQLSGRIPEELGRMQRLETLDLSSNHLSGSIPVSMTSITSLSYLNLSYNDLYGPIPSANQFGTFTDPSIFEGNPKLCGKPLVRNCSPPGKSEVKESIDEEEDDDRVWFLLGTGMGFVTAFLAIFSSLMFNKWFGYRCFHFLEQVGENIIRFCIGFRVYLNRIFSMRRN